MAKKKKKDRAQNEGKTPPEESPGRHTFAYWYVVAALEGGSVMAVELCGAKIIAPFYGTSLYVWASVLGVTLGGLAAGYFVGGFLSHRYPTKALLHVVLGAAAFFTAIMPLTAPHLMAVCSGLGVRWGSLVSAVFFMMPPLLCMGMVSPILIQLATESLQDAGRTAGKVYAVSTLGGIVMTILVGFYFIPSWGIRISVMIASSLVAFPPVVALFSQRRVLSSGLLVVLLAGPHMGSLAATTRTGSLAVRHRSEGLLGQVMVVDVPGRSGRTHRRLLINCISQTAVELGNESVSLNAYIHRLVAPACIKPPGSRALILGFGGGSIAMEFLKMGFLVDGLELDSRMFPLAREFFDFDPPPGAFTGIVDDARRYMRTTRRKYDIVAIDLLNGEAQPSHVFTVEGMTDLRGILAKDGLVLIEFQGALLGSEGIAARSVRKTLQESGFHVLFHRAGPADRGDTVFVASPSPLEFSDAPIERLNPCCRSLARTGKDLVTHQPIDDLPAVILRDDKPIMEILNRRENEQWRFRVLTKGPKEFVKRRLSLFK